ncbi:hypothetical protein ACFLSX_04675 [Calditrichota bacterium]
MKINNYIRVLILFQIYCFTITLTVQGEFAAPFLITDPSANLNGMAGAFTGLPVDDVYGAYFNPAQLGNLGRNNSIAVGFYPIKTRWLPKINISDLTYHASAFAIGYEFSTSIPISIGLGYIYSKMDWGENVWTDASGNELGKFHSYESCDAFSFGMRLDYLLEFNLGLTIKDINLNLFPAYFKVGGNNEDAKTDVLALSYGILINVPFVNILNEFYRTLNENKFTPFFDVSLGYSIHNIGSELNYRLHGENEPMPRQARLGYGISIGLIQKYHGYNINVIKFEYSNEARDFLINREAGKIEYQDLMGDIDFFDNVIAGKSSENVDIFHGWRLRIVDTFQYSIGRIESNGYFEFKESTGILVSSKGLLIWLSGNIEDNTLKYIADHFIFEYAWSKYNSDNEYYDNTEYKGIQLKLFGFY